MKESWFSRGMKMSSFVDPEAVVPRRPHRGGVTRPRNLDLHEEERPLPSELVQAARPANTGS